MVVASFFGDISAGVFMAIQIPLWAVALLFFLGLLFLSMMVSVIFFPGYSILLGALLLFTLGIVSLYGAIWAYRRAVIIRNTPTERVRSISLGRTQLEGVCRPAAQVFSQPFADGECLYAAWRIEEYTKSGDDRDWSTVARGALSDRLYLEDDTGKVLVDDPASAKVTISKENTLTETLGRNSTPAPEIAEFCRQQDVAPTASNKRRYRQRVLTDGTDIYVLGGARRLDNPDEYDSMNDIIVTRDDGPYPFLISDKAERELERFYRNWAIGMLITGLVVSAATLYIILLELQTGGLL